MKLKNKSIRNLDEALASIDAGQCSVKDAISIYPELAEEIRLALRLREAGEALTPEIPIIEHRERKITQLQRLPVRRKSVTNKERRRYTMHNVQRRYFMSWIIIFTTILSLASGAGAVYASDDALPGETLYPIKTLVENVRLAVAQEESEPGLRLMFADRRLEELYEIYTTGDLDEVEEVAQGYENQVQLVTRLIEQVQAHDPDEAVRLRQELQTKLQLHARQMEELVEDESEAVGEQVRERVRLALQTNTRLQLRSNEATDDWEISDGGQVEVEDDPAVEDPDDAGNGQGKGQIKARVYSTDEGALFEFDLNGQGRNGVYAEIGDSRFACEVTDDTAVCPVGPVKEQDRIRLHDAQTGELLFSYQYQYKMQSQQKNQNGQNGNGGSGDGSEGGEENRNGKGN